MAFLIIKSLIISKIVKFEPLFKSKNVSKRERALIRGRALITSNTVDVNGSTPAIDLPTEED